MKITKDDEPLIKLLLDIVEYLREHNYEFDLQVNDNAFKLMGYKLEDKGDN